MLSLSDLTPGDQDQIRSDLRIAGIGGVVAALVMGALVVTVGSLSPTKAQSLLESSLPTVRFACSSVMAASATTLALMLTLLGLSTGTDREIKASHFERIRQIAFVDVVAFVGATLLLTTLVVPFTETSEIPSGWYNAIYYITSLMSALLGGLMVAVMLLLYAAVRDLITVVRPDGESRLYANDEPADEAGHDRAEADGDARG